MLLLASLWSIQSTIQSYIVVCFVKMLSSVLCMVYRCNDVCVLYCSLIFHFCLFACAFETENIKKNNNQSLYFFNTGQRENKTESCRILEWSELFFLSCRYLHRWNFCMWCVRKKKFAKNSNLHFLLRSMICATNPTKRRFKSLREIHKVFAFWINTTKID